MWMNAHTTIKESSRQARASYDSMTTQVRPNRSAWDHTHRSMQRWRQSSSLSEQLSNMASGICSSALIPTMHGSVSPATLTSRSSIKTSFKHAMKASQPMICSCTGRRSEVILETQDPTKTTTIKQTHWPKQEPYMEIHGNSNPHNQP